MIRSSASSRHSDSHSTEELYEEDTPDGRKGAGRRLAQRRPETRESTAKRAGPGGAVCGKQGNGQGGAAKTAKFRLDIGAAASCHHRQRLLVAGRPGTALFHIEKQRAFST